MTDETSETGAGRKSMGDRLAAAAAVPLVVAIGVAAVGAAGAYLALSWIASRKDAEDRPAPDGGAA